MQASSTDGSKGQKALNAYLVWDFSGTHSGPVTAAVAGFSSAAWPEFGPPYTVLRLWKEMARGGLFPCRDQIEPSMLGEDWANCLVIAVQSPVGLSHFVEVGNNLSMMRCPNNSLAGVLLSHLPQVLSERQCLMIEGWAYIAPVSLGAPTIIRGWSILLGEVDAPVPTSITIVTRGMTVLSIDMPSDFPTAAYDAVGEKLGLWAADGARMGTPAHTLWAEYAAGWNAVGYRFRTAADADTANTVPNVHAKGPEKHQSRTHDKEIQGSVPRNTNSESFFESFRRSKI